MNVWYKLMLVSKTAQTQKVVITALVALAIV